MSSALLRGRDYVACPYCGESEDRVDHLYGDNLPREAGPWYCDECGRAYRLTIRAPGDVEVHTTDQRWTRQLVLLRLDGRDGPVFFVMKGKRFGEDQNNVRYYYEEHSCPTNWLHDCVAVIANRRRLPHEWLRSVAAVVVHGDADPHGFLTFVRAADAPSNYDEIEENDLWSEVFPEAFGGEVIDNELPRLGISWEEHDE